jgi:surfactin synthase thioesterase subunit
LLRKWLSHHTPQPASALRLLCFPYAGGGAVIYRSLAKRLSPKIEVCPIQLPGRANRFSEPAFTRMEDLVAALERDLAPLFDKPFALFGHSMGAVISYELARTLMARRGLEPRHLFVAGRRGPQVPSPRAPIYNLPDDRFIAELRALSGTPQEVLDNPELMAIALPLLRADFEVSERYAAGPGPTLRCPITALAGAGDHETPPALMEPWREATTGPFKLIACPGDHFFIHAQESLVADAINAGLARDLAA